MYAIVDIAGQQFKVEKDSKVFAHRLEGKEGSKVTFDKVLLVDDKGKVTVGAPTVAGATVSAKIVSHVKDDKLIVFKKKRRKGYQKSNGHRQALTELLIEGLRLQKRKLLLKQKRNQTIKHNFSLKAHNHGTQERSR